MATLVANASNIDFLLSPKYSHIGLITTFTNKKIIARYNPKKTTADNLINAVLNKLDYKCNEVSKDDLMLKYDEDLLLEKDKLLDKIIKTDEKLTKFTFCDKKNYNLDFYGLNFRSLHGTDILKKSEQSNDKIYVKTLTGKTIAIGIFDEMKFEDFVSLIWYKEGIPPDQMRLCFAGKSVDKNIFKKLKKDNTVHLVLRLRGGMYHESSGKNGDFDSLGLCIIDIDLEDSNEEDDIKVIDI